MASGTRLAIVSGTTSGIGQAVARILLDRGWRVVGLARRPAAIDDPAYEHFAVDLSDAADVGDAVESQLTAIVARPGWTRVGLVNNAAHAGLLGPIEQISPVDFNRLLALNVVVPVWLMGLVVSHVARDVALRIVNVSTGAAVQGFPGLGAYGSSKAALRMAGMVLAAEATAPPPGHRGPASVAVLSYEPGTVDTPMQADTRATAPERFPWVDLFHRFKNEGMLVPAERPASEIVGFLEGDDHAAFTERRYGRPS